MFSPHTAAGKSSDGSIVKAYRAEADMLSRLRPASSADDVHVSCDQETDRVRNGLACSIGSASPTQGGGGTWKMYQHSLFFFRGFG